MYDVVMEKMVVDSWEEKDEKTSQLNCFINYFSLKISFVPHFYIKVTGILYV